MGCSHNPDETCRSGKWRSCSKHYSLKLTVNTGHDLLGSRECEYASLGTRGNLINGERQVEKDRHSKQILETSEP